MSRLEQKPVSERLKNGATQLGKLWRSKVRCQDGWDAYLCGCVKKSAFCVGKLQWIMLAASEGRPQEDGEFGLALMMTASEWDLTGLSMEVEIEDSGTFKLGQKAESTMKDFGELSKDPESAKSVLMVMKKFGGSSMELPEEELV
jgi:hypothetical protein